jgi:hypothetical protein
MSWNFNEIVRSGNSQARVKNYYPDTGLLVIYDIYGVFEVGDTIIGDESGTTLTLTEFNISYDFDLYYDPTYWDNVLPNVVYQESDGEILALDEHFTGLPSQDYQTTYLVVVD